MRGRLGVAVERAARVWAGDLEVVSVSTLLDQKLLAAGRS